MEKKHTYKVFVSLVPRIEEWLNIFYTSLLCYKDEKVEMWIKHLYNFPYFVKLWSVDCVCVCVCVCVCARVHTCACACILWQLSVTLVVRCQDRIRQWEMGGETLEEETQLWKCGEKCYALCNGIHCFKATSLQLSCKDFYGEVSAYSLKIFIINIHSLDLLFEGCFWKY